MKCDIEINLNFKKRKATEFQITKWSEQVTWFKEDDIIVIFF